MNSGKSDASSKRCSDGGDEQPFKKLKFSKESVLKELNFVKRAGAKEDGHLTTGETISDAETEIDEDVKSKLMCHNVAKKYTFGDGGQQKFVDGEGEKKSPSDGTGAGDGAGAHELLGVRSVNRPKHIK